MLGMAMPPVSGNKNENDEPKANIHPEHGIAHECNLDDSGGFGMERYSRHG